MEPTGNFHIIPSAFPMREELKDPDVLVRAGSQGAQRAGSRQQNHNSHFSLFSEGMGLPGWDFPGVERSAEVVSGTEPSAFTS